MKCTNKYLQTGITLLIPVAGMLLGSAVLLFILCLAIYCFKWQVQQAQIGITVTYILTGILGGVILRYCKTSEWRYPYIIGMLPGTLYMLLLLILSANVIPQQAWDFGQLVAVWLLLVCGSELGYVVRKKTYK